MPFISCPCPIDLARTFTMIVNRSSENRYPCHVPKGERFPYSIKKYVSCGFFIDGLYWVEEVLLQFYWVFLYHDRYWILWNAFFVSIDMIMWFLFFSLFSLFCLFLTFERQFWPQRSLFIMYFISLMSVGIFIIFFLFQAYFAVSALT